MKMKKITAIIMAGIMASAFTVSASAHGCGWGSGKCHKDRPCRSYCTTCFADENNDGVCDNCGRICAFTDKNGDGICDNCHFTDENGDGICDNAGLNTNCGKRHCRHN